MATGSTLEVHQAFTSDNTPKGGAETQRVMRTLKEDPLWLWEWVGPFESVRALAA
jgi:hypothetical protein